MRVRLPCSVAWVADWTAKLLVLPFVGAGLCGTVTLLVGAQCVDALRPACAAWLAAYRVAPAVDGGESSGGDRNDPRSPSSRPIKRQRSDDGASRADGSGSSPDADRADQDVSHGPLIQRMPKPPRQVSLTPPRPKRRRVFIWDLDETLVLFASLYTGAFAQTHGKEVAPGVALGEQMMTFLLAMLERHFFFSDLHDADVDHIACAEGASCANCRALHTAREAATANANDGEEDEEDEDREVKARYSRIREIYEQRGRVDFLHDTGSEWFAVRAALVAAIDSFSTGWLHEARQVLSLIAESKQRPVESSENDPENHEPGRKPVGNDPSAGDQQEDGRGSPRAAKLESDEEEEEEVENVNILVTNTQLVPALCKCLVYQLDAFFPIDHIYSSAKVHKYRCFETILAKYDGPEVDFVAIGDGLEEEQVSLALGLEFHKIRSLVDLKRLRYDLQLDGARTVAHPQLVDVQQQA